jgi:uncharacterized protein (DUF1786 family)
VHPLLLSRQKRFRKFPEAIRQQLEKDGIYYKETNIPQHFAPLPRAQAGVQFFTVIWLFCISSSNAFLSVVSTVEFSPTLA